MSNSTQGQNILRRETPHFDLNIKILAHDQGLQKNIALKLLDMLMFHLGHAGTDCRNDENIKKLTAFGGRYLVLLWGLEYTHFLEVQNETWAY